MREILFRGKMKTDNRQYKKGDWVFGDLCRLKDGDKELPHIYGCGEVFADTVGQYTGLTDMNERKIYEGDIVHIHYDIMPDAGYIGAVFYNAELTQFQVEHPGYITNLGEAFSTGKVEVIGNRWDNPAILKKE